MILGKIVESTRALVAERKERTPVSALEGQAVGQDPPRDFAGALRQPTICLIAEVKRASPSKGALRPDLDVRALVRTYTQSGAAAISVLTEPDFFQGSLADLDAARISTDVPVLRKDFVIDEYQVYEARAHGADAVLLIGAILSLNELKSLLDSIHALGMTALVEVHNRSELELALNRSPAVVGINNRNLADFTIDLETTYSLRPLIPPEVVVVSESGIRTHEDVLRLSEAGVDAILVGEALVTSPDPAAKISELLGRTRQEAS